MPELPKAYEPKAVEERLYRFWVEGGDFTPKIDPQREPFVIIMPPPNVTGELHLGHALTATLEDIMVRWHRMRGESTLWLPGRDHAGIAAQFVVEQQLAREGLSRRDLGREKFLERMWQWMDKYGRVIAEQHKRLGASCDWARERFTMDPGPSLAVRTTFVRLYRKGLIYRGERIINWCPRCQTALSDLEVDHQEVKGKLWYVRYPLEGEEGYITVATTRPETILGDTAVAVNPEDPRHRPLVGKKVLLPAVERVIPIIADGVVDPAFGTGAVKVTPAHDPVDFDISQRQGLPLVNILNPDGTMNQNAGPFAGLDRFECRKRLLEYLKERQLYVKEEEHLHAVGHCYRCGTVVEPWASKQWFIRMEPLAQPAIQAVKEGRIRIIPEHFVKVYLNWMENLRDWCISRQLWWGHRIPVWYCGKCQGITVSTKDPERCRKCGAEDIVQDPDVLDTWFSSALWPHSTLGWPRRTRDFLHFYPTSVMETGYDILFFWVARMIVMGLENTGEVPFRTVYLHGLIRDEKGQKMSKVRGNVLNPLDLIERYGCDALRFALTMGVGPGNDLRLSPQKLEAGRNFANKLWNAARFVLRSLEQYGTLGPSPLDVEDRWLRSRLNRVVAEANRLMEAYLFGEAERPVHDFIWGEYCDWYVELSKLRLQRGENPLPTLVEALETSLRLLHPFMPFITEEIWQKLPGPRRSESIMVASFPHADEKAYDPQAEEEMEAVIEVIRSIRHSRTERKIEPERFLEARLYSRGDRSRLSAHANAIEALARARPLSIYEGARPAGDRGIVLVVKAGEVLLPLEGLDLERERQRLEKEKDLAHRELVRLEARLRDENFVSRAPREVVEGERSKHALLTDRLQRLGEELSRLG